MENNSSVIGRLSFLANVVGDGAVAGIQQMARGTGAAMTKLASAVPAAAFATSAAALAGIGAALAGGVVAAAQFEDSFALVRKVLARASEEELADIRQGIIDLSTEIPVAAGQLAQLGSIAGQLGVGVRDIPQFIDTVAKLGVATNMTAEQAAFSVARLANVTGIGAENADQLANVLVRLGNNTAATESEIVLLATRFGAVGKIAGLTADQTLAFSASVRATGTEAQAGATALQKFFLALQQAASQGGARLNAFAQAVGMSSDEFRKLAQEDISEAAVAFVEGLDSIGASGGDVQRVLNEVGLGSVRVSKVMLSLSSDTEELRSNLFLANDEMERQSALNNEAEKRFGTLLNQMARFRNVIKAVMIDIGEGLVPVLADFIGNLADAIAGVREFSDVLNTDTFVNAAKTFAVLTAALGLSKIAAARAAFDALAVSVLYAAEGAFKAAGGFKALMLAFKPLLIGGAIILGITAIVKIFGNMADEIAGAKRNLDDFKDVMDNLSLDDVDISDELAQGLFENLEEETQNALKAAFGRDTTDVLKEVLGNQSREVLQNVQALVQGLSATIGQTSSYLVTDEQASNMLENQLKLSKENLKVIEEEFGTESEIFKLGQSVVGVLQKRVEEGGKLTVGEQRKLFVLEGQIGAYEEILNLQTAQLDIKMEELEALVTEQLEDDGRRFRRAEILDTDEKILAVAKQLAPRNKEIADLIGFQAESSEEVAENMGAFSTILQNANDFAAELNAQLKPLEALSDLEDAQDSLSDAKKDIVDLNKEEVELNDELVALERELQDLMKEGALLSEDLINIKEEELELAEMIAMANGDITLTYQEQLKLLKLRREREILVKAAQQGTLSNAEIQIGAIDEQIKAIETRGVTEEDIAKKEEEITNMKVDAQANAQQRIIDIQEEQEEIVDRLIDLEEDREDAVRAVEKAQIDVLRKTNETVIAFAELNNKGTEDLKALAKALGMPEAVIDSILSKVVATRIAIEQMPAFAVPQLAADMASLQSTQFTPAPRHSGGPVRIGQRAFVGETGPELITPMPNGIMVKPMTGGGGRGGITQNVSLNITGLPTDPIAARKIAQNIQRELNKLRGDGRSGIVR